MTRILALGDTQLGVATVDLADQRAVLDRIVDVALERNVDVVIHGGDVFEGPVVLPEHLRVFMDAVNRLHAHQIPVVVLRGNGRHDLATRSVHGLDIFNDLGVIVCDRPKIVDVKGLSIVALPWVHPGRLIAEFDGAVDHDLVNQRAANLLVRIARDLDPVISPSILVCHWAISGSALPTGLPVDEMREPILPWAELDALGYDAIIGAHIHQPQQISQPLVDKTLGIVVGSPQQLNFGEHGEHGCWILEIDSSDGEAVAEFVPIESKKFVTIDWAATDDGYFMGFDIEDVIPDDGALHDVEIVRDGDVVRVRLTATEQQAAKVDHGRLRDGFLAAGASRVQIEPQIVRKDRARVTTVNEQLSQAEALAAWCDANDIDSAMRERMIERLGAWA